MTDQEASSNSGSPAGPMTKKPARLLRWLRCLFMCLLWLVVILLTVWAVAALYFDARVEWLRVPLAVIYAAGAIIACVKLRMKLRAAGVCCGGFLLVLGWWLTLAPSNNRDWLPDVAVLPYADITPTNATIHNIRNCDYRTATDFDVRHYDKTYDLEKLRSVDLMLIYWGSPNIAHLMVSFGFDGDDYVCMSIETRKEKGEKYSAVKGAFRQFELTFIIADERDVVRLRTNYRKHEDVYLYRMGMTPEQGRTLFLNYLRSANSLREKPEWYNAITGNCTTSVRAQRAATDRIPWDWRMLINGHLDEFFYEHKLIPTSLPFAELRERCRVNDNAHTADQSAEFSKLIRRGVPGQNP